MIRLLTRLISPLLISGIALSTHLSSHAQIIVSGPGPEQACYEKALYDNPGTKSAIKTCDEALTRILSRKDKAATYVNRGILLLRDAQFEAARDDYLKAIELAPELSEARMNYGAALIHLRDYEGALKTLNDVIDNHSSPHMHQALYNRAIIYDIQQKYTLAYKDLKRALEISPDFQDAIKSLERYSVVSKKSG